MAGPGTGFARLTIKAGSPCFSTEGLIGKRTVDADLPIEALPRLVRSMREQLARANAREEREVSR